MTGDTTPDEVESENRRLAERQCNVGHPRGPRGIIEYVYRGRLHGQLRAKIIMDSGTVRYADLPMVYPR